MTCVLLLLVSGLAVRAPRGVALEDFSGETYTARRTITSSSTFRDCTFKGIRASSDGGALYVNNEAVSLGVVACIFDTCRGSTGGAIHAMVHALSVNRSSAVSCVATATSPFLYGYFFVAASSQREVRDTSVTASSCSTSNTLDIGGTISLRTENFSVSTATYVDSLNSSGNTGSVSGSGIYLCYIYNLSFKFSTFTKDSPTSTLFFDWHIINSDVSCLTLNNNSCPKSGRYPGLIYIESTVTIASSVFQGNTYDYFLGTYYREVGTLIFVKSVFDVPVLNATAAVTFATRDCVVEQQITALAECKKVIPSRSRDPGPPVVRRLAGVRMFGEMGSGPLAAVLAACMAVIVAAAFVGLGIGRMMAGWLRQREGHDEHLEGDDPE